MNTLRLTRRGRLVLVLLVMGLLVVAGLTVGHGFGHAADNHQQAQHAVIVQPGESLWTVANRIAPHDDPRAVIVELQALNHLVTSAVEPGERLIVPFSS